jgi:hypothetical protein
MELESVKRDLALFFKLISDSEEEVSFLFKILKIEILKRELAENNRFELYDAF